MYRYDKLLAGASWVDEYGDPDNEDEWEYIQKYSPYQNVFSNQDYPEVYFYTSTKDDRVHPGHARKMAKKMLDQGHEVIYYENVEGGHSAASNYEQSAFYVFIATRVLNRQVKKLVLHDITLVTCKKYFQPRKANDYILNIQKEENLIRDALQNNGLRVDVAYWDDVNYDWSKQKLH